MIDCGVQAGREGRGCFHHSQQETDVKTQDKDKSGHASGEGRGFICPSPTK